MPSHNRFSVVTLRKWQKNGKRLAFVLVRIQHLIHIDFDSKLGLRGAAPIEAVCHLKQKSHSKLFVSPNRVFSLGTDLPKKQNGGIIYQDDLILISNVQLQHVPKIISLHQFFIQRGSLKHSRFQSIVFFSSLFLAPAAVGILCYRQNGPLKNLFSLSTIQSVVFQAFVCFERVIITSVCPKIRYQKSRQISKTLRM